MAFTLTELQALEAAYAQGILSVTHKGKTVVYPSAADMWSRIQQIRAELRPRTQRHNAALAGYSRR